MSAETRIM